MKALLSDIQAMQVPGNNPVYPEGIFPSQRRHSATGTKREDDNSFFTALVVFTLNRLKKYFSTEEIKIVEDIRQKATHAFQRYENKKGEHSYNFWRTEKNAHFPNGKIFSKFDYFRLADDVDCTALVYLAQGFSEEDILRLRNKLMYHANLPLKVSKNTLPRYKNFKVYSTWFGKNIPVEMDVCVTANLLYLLFESKTPFNKNDLDCIRYVCSVITNDEHKSAPFRVAPYYPKTSIILYHISRLLTVAKHPDLLQLKEKLKRDIIQELSGRCHAMERVILNTSLMWLGETTHIEELQMPADISFPWFIAGMLTSVENGFIRMFAPLPLFHIQFYCEAYMKTLFIEYRVLRDNTSLV